MTNAQFLVSARDAALEAIARGSPLNALAAAAHAANESTYGRSLLATDANNLFGTKATGRTTPYWSGDTVVMPTWEVVNGQRVDEVARFRKYASWADAFGDYGDIISRVYPLARGDDPLGFLAGLFLIGQRRWATDPSAFDKIARILATNLGILRGPPGDGTLEFASTVVLHDLSLADRWRVLFPSADGSVLRGRFVWRHRPPKLDVRRG